MYIPKVVNNNLIKKKNCLIYYFTLSKLPKIIKNPPHNQDVPSCASKAGRLLVMGCKKSFSLQKTNANLSNLFLSNLFLSKKQSLHQSLPTRLVVHSMLVLHMATNTLLHFYIVVGVHLNLSTSWLSYLP